MNKKKLHRKVNAYVKTINKNIYNDELWKGRFIIREYHFQAISYGFNDFTEYFRFILIDKQTSKTKITGWYSSFQILTLNCLWLDMNDFITKDIDVWKEKPTRLTTKDYR